MEYMTPTEIDLWMRSLDNAATEMIDDQEAVAFFDDWWWVLASELSYMND